MSSSEKAFQLLQKEISSSPSPSSSKTKWFLAVTLAALINQEEEDETNNNEKYFKLLDEILGDDKSNTAPSSPFSSTSPLLPILPSAARTFISRRRSSSTSTSFLVLPPSLAATSGFSPLASGAQNPAMNIPTSFSLLGWGKPSSTSSSASQHHQKDEDELPSSATVAPQWLLNIVHELKQQGGRSKFESNAKNAHKKNLIDEQYLLSINDGDNNENDKKKKYSQDELNDAYLRSLLGVSSSSTSSSTFNLSKCKVLHSRERIPVLLTSSNNENRFILKADDDVRLESLAMLIVRWCNAVWEREGVKCSAVPYDITALSGTALRKEHAKSSSTANNNERTSSTKSAFGGFGKKKSKASSSKGGDEDMNSFFDHDDDGTSVGLVEFLSDTKSIHEVREEIVSHNSDTNKNPKFKDTMIPFLQNLLLLSSSSTSEGEEKDDDDEIQQHFISTFCGACVTQYLIALKDRHNANILLRRRSSDVEWINIDYSFCFGRKPGGAFSLESAPFRFPEEVLFGGGMVMMSANSDDDNEQEEQVQEEEEGAEENSKNKSSTSSPSSIHNIKNLLKEASSSSTNNSSSTSSNIQGLVQFSNLFIDALLAIRKHFSELELILSAIPTESLSKLTCFTSSSESKNPHAALVSQMEKRLFVAKSKKPTSKKAENNDGDDNQQQGEEEQLRKKILNEVIIDSLGHKGTKLYDSFQKKSNDILCAP